MARWGRVAWRGDRTGSAFRTRSGNGARPDATWSDWSAPLTDPAHAAITSPNARYLQWRAEFSGSPAELDNVIDCLFAAEHSARGSQHQCQRRKRAEGGVECGGSQCLFGHGDGYGGYFRRGHAFADHLARGHASNSRSPGRRTMRMATG